MIATISQMRSIRRLALNSWHVTDVGIEYIATMTQLEILDISGTSISDTAIEYLTALPQLRILSCEHTQLTDRCVFSLLRIGCLEEVSLLGTRVSREGTRMLALRKPQLHVVSMGQSVE
jgi:hypothetical protein